MSKSTASKLENYVFSNATSEQIALLESLHKERIYLHQFLNRPKSVVVSAILVPAFMYFLFFREQAWLHGVYLSTAEFFQNYAIDSIPRIVENSPDFKRLLNKQVTKPFFSEICRQLESSKPQILPCYEQIVSLSECDPEDIIQTAQLAANLGITVAKLKQIISRYLLAVSSWRTAYTTALRTTYIPAKFSRFVIAKITHPAIIVIEALGQRYFLDPILLNFWPGRLAIQNPVMPYIQCQRDSDDAANEIKILQAAQEKLKQNAQAHKTFARWVALFALLIAIYNLRFSNPETASPTITAICIGTLATATKDSFQDVRNWRQSRKMAAQVTQTLELLNTLTAVLDQEWQYQPSETPDNGYFYIELQPLKSLAEFKKLKQHEQLSPYFLAKKLEYYLGKHGILAKHSTNHWVIIAGDVNLTAAIADKMSTAFQTAIRRFVQIRQLKNQLSAIGLVTTIPYQDEKDLPSMHFYLPLIATLTLELEHTGNTVNEESPFLIVTGHQPINPQILAKLKPHIHLPDAQNEIKEYPSTPPAFSNSIRSCKTKIKVKKISQTVTAEDKKPLAKIFWGTDCFDPDDKNCPVKLMRPFSLSQGRHFVVFKLKKEHMPKGYPPTLYEKLQQSVLQGQIGADKQGWKFISPQLGYDLTNGKPETFTCKFRNFGLFGNFRLYAPSITVHTPNGDKILHPITGLNAKAHTR